MPQNGFGISICFFHNITGLPCPGCGLTRSVAAVLHLHFWEAMRFHPLGIAACVAVLFFAISGLHRQTADFYIRHSKSITVLLVSAGVILVIFGTIRIFWIVQFPQSAVNYFYFIREPGIMQRYLF